MIEVTEKFFEDVFNHNKLQEERAFDFVSIVINCVRLNKEVHDAKFVEKFCIDRIKEERERPYGQATIAKDYFESKTFIDFEKEAREKIKEYGTKANCRMELTSLEQEEVLLFLRMYIVLVDEYSKKDVESDGIRFKGEYKRNSTKNKIIELINKLNEKKNLND